MQAPTPIDVLPLLNDQDVAILYDIVSLAQHSSHRPIRALFDAYEEILPRAGTDTDHDSRYFRFLSHSGTELAKDGTRSLVRRFRALLERAGIQLVLEDGGEDSVSAIGEHLERLSSAGSDVEPPHQERRGRSRRRASFNDTNLDTTWLSADKFEPAHKTNLRRPRHASIDLVSQARRRQPVRDTSAALLPGYRRTPAHTHVQDPDTEEHRRGRYQALKADADAFHFSTLARKCVWLWHARATQVRRRQQDLLHIASNYDRRVLLKQSFAQIRDAGFDKQFWDQQERRAGRARNLFLLTKAFTHWAQTASDEVIRTNVAKRHILRTRYFNAWKDITAVNELKCRRVGQRKWFDVWRSKAHAAIQQAEEAARYDQSRVIHRSYWIWFWSLCERKAPEWRDWKLRSASLATLKRLAMERRSRDLAAQGSRNHELQRKSMQSLTRRSLQIISAEAAANDHRRRHLMSTAFAALCRKSTFDPRELHIRKHISKRVQQQALQSWVIAAAESRLAGDVDRKRILSNVWTAWNDHLRTRALKAKIDDRVLIQALYRWVLEERFTLFQRVTQHRQRANAIRRLSIRLAERQFQLNEALQMCYYNQDMRLKQISVVRWHASSRADEQKTLVAMEFRNARDLPRAFAKWKESSKHVRQLAEWSYQARYYCLAKSTITRWKEVTTEGQRRRRRDAYAVVRQRQKSDLMRRSLQALVTQAMHYQSSERQAEQHHRQKTLATSKEYFSIWHTKFGQWQNDEREAGERIAEYRVGDALSAIILKLSDISQQNARAQMIIKDGQEKAGLKMLRKLSDTAFVLQRQNDTALAWRDRKHTQHRREMIRYWDVRANDMRATRIDPNSPSKPSTLKASRRSQSAAQQAAADETLIDFSTTILGQEAGEHANTTVNATPLPGYLGSPSKRAQRARARFKGASERANRFRAMEDSGLVDFGSSALGSTTPAPFAAGGLDGMEVLTPQVTPFQRKMRAGGYNESTTPLTAPRAGRWAALAASRSRHQNTGRAVRFGDVDVTGDARADADADAVDETADWSPS